MSDNGYSQLGKLIVDRLHFLDLSQQEIGRSVNRHAQWINGLLKDTRTGKVLGGGKEDFDKLFRILAVKDPKSLAKISVKNPSGRPKTIDIVDPDKLPKLGEVDELLYLKLVLALLDQASESRRYESSYSFDYVLKLQNRLAHSEIWVFTSTLGESHNEKYADRTMDGVLKQKNIYRFFLPFDDEKHWQLGLDRLKAAYDRKVKEMKADDPAFTPPLLEDSIQLFGINMLMVHSITIINPTSDDPIAHISIGAWDSANTRFVPIHADRVKANIDRYRLVYRMGMTIDNPPKGAYGIKEDTASGMKVKRYFPRTFDNKH